MRTLVDALARLSPELKENGWVRMSTQKFIYMGTGWSQTLLFEPNQLRLRYHLFGPLGDLRSSDGHIFPYQDDGMVHALMHDSYIVANVVGIQQQLACTWGARGNVNRKRFHTAYTGLLDKRVERREFWVSPARGELQYTLSCFETDRASTWEKEGLRYYSIHCNQEPWVLSWGPGCFVKFNDHETHMTTDGLVKFIQALFASPTPNPSEELLHAHLPWTRLVPYTKG